MIRPRRPSVELRAAEATATFHIRDLGTPSAHAGAAFSVMSQTEMLLEVVFAVEGALVEVFDLAGGEVVALEMRGVGGREVAEGADGAGGGVDRAT